MSTNLKSAEIVGKKENVSDIISMIDPTETPFVSSIKTEKVTQHTYQWMEDALQPVGDNAKLEGAAAVNDNFDQPEMRTNITQILSKTYELSGSAAVTKAYGRENEEARLKLNAIKSVRRDLEHACVGTGQTVVNRTASVAGKFAGAQAMISSTVTTAAAGAALTKDILDDTHLKAWDAGATPTIAMVSAKNAHRISGFFGSSRKINDDNKTATDVVEVYVNAYGTLKVVKNRRLRATDVILFDPKNFKLVSLREFKNEELAKAGDSERAMIVGEYGLKHVNFKASALISGLEA